MSAYIVVHATVKDQEKFKEYGAQAGPVVQAHGGKVVARGPAEVLSGESPYQLMVILEFPDKAAASGWYHSGDYQALIPLRDSALDNVFVLGGE